MPVVNEILSRLHSAAASRAHHRERKRRYFVEFTSDRIFNAIAGRSISRKQQHQQIEGVLTQQGADSVGDVSDQIKRSAACEKFFSFSDIYILTTKGLELLPPFKNLPRAWWVRPAWAPSWGGTCWGVKKKCLSHHPFDSHSSKD